VQVEHGTGWGGSAVWVGCEVENWVGVDGILTGRVTSDRGVVAERARGVKVACAQE